LRERKGVVIRTPILTIVIPTLNGAAFLTDAITSCCLQAEGLSVEILVIDNHSSDETPRLLKGLLGQGMKIRVLRNSQQLPSAENYLEAVRQSLGEWVWFLADDDVITPNAVQTMLDVIQSHKPNVIVCNHLPVDKGLEPLKTLTEELADSTVHSVSHDRIKVLSGSKAFVEIGWEKIGLLSANCFRRSSYLMESDANSSTPPEFDFMYVIPAMMINESVVYISNTLVLFRQYRKRWQTTSDHSALLEIDWVVVPTILNRLLKRGYPRGVVSRIAKVRSLAFFAQVYKSRSLGYKPSHRFVIQVAKANRSNFLIIMQLPLFWAPLSLLEWVNLVYATKLVSRVKTLLKLI
jgi:glycosyltransferase involved in cell wall biosynthesis